jgi:hypothetical protein
MREAYYRVVFFIATVFMVVLLATLLAGCGDDNHYISPTNPCCTDTCEGVHTCDQDTGCSDPCATGGKFTICFNGQTIKIDKEQWPTYKAKGATKGKCKKIPPPPPPGDDDDDDDDCDDSLCPNWCQGGKTTICHVPPGNPDNAHTITIGNSAVEAHFRNHDDYCGPCK